MLNIVEKLKDCPSGIKLYHICYGDVYLKQVDTYRNAVYVSPFEKECWLRVNIDGRHISEYNGECVLFPSKDNRDWDTFSVDKIELPFEPKIGDVVTNENDEIFIYCGNLNGIMNKTCFTLFPKNFIIRYSVTFGNDTHKVLKARRFATNEEKKLLFNEITKEGYIYDELNHCIAKKESKRKFKVGERIMRNNTLYPILTITFVNDMVYTVKSNISDEEHDIGVKIVENCYKIATFSPSDLKPFDRLLVKRHNTWQIAHFGYFKNGVVFTEMGQPCNIDVVPYNDETKHLLGTCDDYDGFYKWWNN